MITSSTWSRVIEGGRPGRGSSDSPSRRRSVNLLRQRCTVEVSRPSSAAICLSVPPSAARSTIFARRARYWAVFARRAHRCSCVRSPAETTNAAFGRPTGPASSSPASPCAANSARHRPAVRSDTPTVRATCGFDMPSVQASTIRARCAAR